MVKLANTLSRLKPSKVLVIGDVLLDSYTFGKVRRLSPEAPVAIVNVQREDHRPGGAGNVALNLISLEAEVVTIGRVGNDVAGELLCQALEREGVAHAIYKQADYKTPVKNRVIAENQQIVRIDHEQPTLLNEQLEQTIITDLPRLLQDVKIVAISDYGKGFLTPTLLQAVIKQAKKQKIRVITDPKGHDFTKYLGTTIIKPNLSEAYAAANLPVGSPLSLVAQRILEATHAEMLMVTRSEAGISLFDAQGNQYDFPVQAKEVKDVTGAGDTVLAMFAHALANELTYGEAVELCNVAAGLAIEHVGCARISLEDLAKRLVERNYGHKIFDHEQLFVLHKILKDKPFTMLILESNQPFTPELYQFIKKLTNEQEPLVVSIKGLDPQQLLIDMLTSLKEVNFILTHSPSYEHSIEPSKTYFFAQEQLSEEEQPSYRS